MRVATYTDSSAPTRGSVYALGVLLLTILLGTGVVPTIAGFAGGMFPLAITPSWLMLYVASFLGLMLHHGINWISWLVRYRILLVFLLLGTILSVSWSIDAQVSVERVVHLTGSTIIAIYIGFSIPLLITLRIFSLVLALTMVASVAAALGLPALGIEEYEGSRVLRGVFNSKNDLGFWAGVGVLLYITLSESFHSVVVKILCFAMALLCFVILLVSQSATSLLATLIAGALCLYLYIASRFQLGFFRMAFVAILFVALTGLAVANIDTSELVGRSGDLTGRGEVWRQVIDLIIKHPLTGVGYGSVWFPTDATIWIQQSLFDFTWVVHHAHNGLLQVASEIGIPLALIALLMVAQQLVEIFYCQYERQQVGVLFVLGFAAAFLISNYSEARFLVTRELFWIFFVALPISMLRQINLVSPDSVKGEPAEDDFHGSLYPDMADNGAVPGKPWLDPQRRGFSQERATSASGAAAASGMLAYEPSYDDATLDELDLSTATLSLSETDIDLGEYIDEHDSTLDSTMDLTADQLDIAAEDVPQEEPEQRVIENQPQTFENDDTYDSDRYDIDFDVTGDWIDIDFNEEK